MISNFSTGLSAVMRSLNGEIETKMPVARYDVKAPKDLKASNDTIGSKEITDTKFEMNYVNWSDSKSKSVDSFDASQINLQEAIIWSEILGKPMCKRRKSR